MISEDLWEYCEAHSSPEDELLAHITRQTHLKVLKPRMLSGPLQGKFLEMLVKMSGARKVLEIGTFTGYATICMARGLSEEGMIITLDINRELEPMVREFFSQSGLENKIDYRLGNALELLAETKETFDFVFIDADKQNYINYYDLVVERLEPGGWIAADNILWSGKVLARNRKKLDKDTAAIMAFNQKVLEDSRVENVVLPIRDGIMLARKYH
ncbi:O-methyltransferase [Cyclobacterium jeungdonense]|uniref:Class I SAM-dependent methyltransferase n=1 Tax=Cyclobacterium jeungdonense TaxID=708087 RepID=A0ABT8C3Z3_9BACT|nr:class I SAM-dependent methyltransferase [Cyclobacterium jeungdonense]MDN3686475.1 class I SAM-dependent methyltransferase [Cyclobacterium jeungdonense]